MRQLVFVNSASVSTTLGNSTYTITSLSGLSTPGQITQEQKSPFQDGATYIDTLFNTREIVCEGAINAKTLAGINSAKDALIKALSPKLGQGWLTYSATNISTKKIQCTASIVFGNKDARDPFQKFLIVFRASDPYWSSVESQTINLPTQLTTNPESINPAATSYQDIIKLANDNLFIVYVRDSDDYVCSREYTGSWGAESVINSNISSEVKVIQLANGNLFLIYLDVGNARIVSRTYSSGSWSGETIITTAVGLAHLNVIQLANGNIYLVYRRPSDSYFVSKTYTTSWGSEVVITSTNINNPSIMQKTNGDLIIAYIKQSDGKLYTITYTTAWGTAELVNNAASGSPNLILLSTGVILLSYNNGSNYLVKREYTVQWSTEAQIGDEVGLSPKVVQIANGDLLFSYIDNATSNLVAQYRTITPVNAPVAGHTTTSVKIVFTGPSVNPRIINQETLEYVRFNKTLLAGDIITINTDQKGPSAVLVDGGITKNGMIYLDFGSTFFYVSPGDNTIYFEDDSVLSTATATMEWYERYIGC